MEPLEPEEPGRAKTLAQVLDQRVDLAELMLEPEERVVMAEL